MNTDSDKPAALPKRTPEEITQEFTALCIQAGEQQYKMKVCEAKLFQLNQRMVQLDDEHSKAKLREEQENAKAAQ